MNILIVSTSFVVKELLGLILKDKNYNLESQEDVENANRENYDIVFIDDSVQDLTSQIEYVQDGLKSPVALLTNTDSNIEATYVVVKPFLPYDIESIMEQLKDKITTATPTNILDPEEVAKIKELMEMDDETESQEDILENIELLKDKKSLKVKKKEAKELLLELCELDKKELKKLLKGAKVSIKISYKKSEDE